MSTPREDPDAELAALRSENAELREALRLAARSAASTPSARPTGRWRTAIAIPLIALGSILVPVAVVAAWAATEVTNTDRFAESLAPLSHDPEVRDFIGTEIVRVIENSVDIDQLTEDAFDSFAQLGLPPRATAAITNLAPAAADGIRNLLNSAVHQAVDSPAFQQVWDQTLRLSHKEFLQILNDDQSAAIVISGSGDVGVQLEPVLERVKSQLEAAQFPFADRIPIVDTTISLGTVDGIVPLRAAYHALLALAAIAPWASVVFLIIGVAVARSRPRATIGAGLGGALGAGLLLVLLVIARFSISTGASAQGVPTDVMHTLFDTLTAAIRAACLAVLVAGLVIAAIGFLSGPSAPAKAVRASAGRGFDAGNRFLEKNHLNGRAFGNALHAMRFAVWTAVGVASVAIIVLVRPLTPAVVGWTTLGAVVFCAIYALFEHRPTSTDRVDGASSTLPTSVR